MVDLYGIANCNTMKKARQWLETHAIDYRFHDYKKEGVNPGRLAAWVEAVGWESLVNRRSTTWRRLPEAERQGVDRDKAVRLMLGHPSLIKRPVLEVGDEVEVGFDPRRYEEIFS